MIEQGKRRPSVDLLKKLAAAHLSARALGARTWVNHFFH
jgi:transcriptional regulator with XRE-family HTH domain